MTKADTEAWAQMRARLYGGLRLEDSRGEIAGMLAKPQWSAYLALEGDASIGFAEICIREYANGCTEEPVPFLEGIWIEEAYRRAGVGRALLQHIAADLKAAGFHELCSDAELANTQSHLAHAGWGFTETERVVYFRKPLG